VKASDLIAASKYLPDPPDPNFGNFDVKTFYFYNFFSERSFMADTNAKMEGYLRVYKILIIILGKFLDELLANLSESSSSPSLTSSPPTPPPSPPSLPETPSFYSPSPTNSSAAPSPSPSPDPSASSPSPLPPDLMEKILNVEFIQKAFSDFPEPPWPGEDEPMTRGKISFR